MEEMTVPDRIENHENRITQLEQNYGKVIEDLGKVREENAQIKHGQVQMENTVLKEFSSQKELTTKLLEHTLEIKKIKTVEEGEMNKIRATQEGEIVKTKITTRKDLFLGLIGGSGIVGVLTLIISLWDEILKWFGG
ncbi:hypothetical protein A8F94_17435 [Bacillus sp. FJAT-27225]|uniref:hypothetical protein n=1 Tax=Bacillus sp. FJAT-27225 TaxID=1743144 RepID=UPI00080C2769|nr:hypothetical protein [Bacillus sp. FJAT-27225]OCA84479.1 hypothetical protein A8F94_17435 [Bacillus sp. FJAT-27225]